MRPTMTEHGRGWVDSQLKLRPPCFADPDYIAGYREGLRSRVQDVLAALNDIAGGTVTARSEHRQMLHIGKHAPFTCAPHPSNAAPRRTWDALPLVLALTLLALSLVGVGLLLPYL